MKKQSDLIADRLKNIITSNRASNVQNLLVILKSDIYNLLSNYMSVQYADIKVVAEESESGYIFRASAFTEELFECGKLID